VAAVVDPKANDFRGYAWGKESYFVELVAVAIELGTVLPISGAGERTALEAPNGVSIQHPVPGFAIRCEPDDAQLDLLVQ
jgi:hypothetical protein